MGGVKLSPLRISKNSESGVTFQGFLSWACLGTKAKDIIVVYIHYRV
jgi:hypothetical protein